MNLRYLLFGLVVLGMLGVVQYRGLSLLSTSEVKNVPKSVRDNPGSYRGAYVGGRILRGK
ncbi:MAG: hypothetical protein MUF00_13700 [Gemmatimonadaceae bacterium]|jgi:hypothetical protein|nr:hypothetical protein [Gemmatimonadaceae bacterium]